MRKLHELNDLLKRVPLLAHVILVLGIGITLWQVDQTSGKVDTKTEETLGTIIAVQVDNCQNDLAFRKQYKIRGDAEKQLLDLFLTLARQGLSAKATPPDQRKTSEDFIHQFAPLTAKIRLIPVPDCRTVEKHLRAVVGANVKIPVIRTATPGKHPSSGPPTGKRSK